MWAEDMFVHLPTQHWSRSVMADECSPSFPQSHQHGFGPRHLASVEAMKTKESKQNKARPIRELPNDATTETLPEACFLNLCEAGVTRAEGRRVF